MKRFILTTALFGISLVAFWAIFNNFALFSARAKHDNRPAPVYDATGEMLKAIQPGEQSSIPVTGANQQTSPVYDATGAMLTAINPNKSVITHPAYDASAAMRDAITP